MIAPHKIKFLIMAMSLFSACTNNTQDTDRAPDPNHDRNPVDSGTAQERPGHAHEHPGAEVLDLDRSVEALFAADCEHDVKAHECATCRYEVGVVRAPASLFEGGLLKTTRPERNAIAVPLRLTGDIRFDARRVAHVSTLSEGIIKKVHVTLGDEVREDQALLEIESVAVGEAQAAYLQAQGMLQLAERNHARIATLRQENISSQKELLVAKRELDAAQIRMDAALGKLTRLGMSRAAAKALRQESAQGRLVLRAPSRGVVLAMHAVAGEVAKSETSLLTVGDNSALWVWADLYERDIAVVTRAQARQLLEAAIDVKAFAGESFAGTVDFISPAMNESSRTVKLRIAVPNPNGRLLAGMFANVNIYIPGDEQKFTLPREAVIEDEGRSFVFVHHVGDYFVRRPVRTGKRFAGLVEIDSGIREDMLVVTEGAFLLKSDVLRSKMGAGCAD